mmetsp:Transcript_81453/g.226483  ORF Transcript_81453/g.226483 Transcript_81453/m.226483 type:complete len:278 (+) Transcript_81453:283-1116(+)
MGHRCQIGAVGLDQQAIQRQQPGQIAQVLRVLEADDARERDAIAALDRRQRDVGRLGETVEDAAGRLAALLVQHAQRVGRARAGVDDQGLACRPGRADMDPKALTLPVHVGDAAAVQAVVVQPGFADCDDARQRRQPQQLGHIGLAQALGVGMHAHRGPELRMFQGQRVHRLELLHLGADADGLHHLGSAHLRQDVGQPLLQLRKAEVAMGINEHRSGADQRVCVGLLEETAVPRISSMRRRISRVFSSPGKRTPTPWVRPADALAGVSQATLPATG